MALFFKPSLDLCQQSHNLISFLFFSENGSTKDMKMVNFKVSKVVNMLPPNCFCLNVNIAALFFIIKSLSLISGRLCLCQINFFNFFFFLI